MLKKILKVTAFVIVALVTLIALACVEENIRGKTAWERHLRELQAKGDTLDILKIAPAPIPDAQNLAAAPLLAELMTATNQDQTRLSRTLKNLFPQGASLGDWRLGQRADMAKLRAAYSNDNLLAALAPAADVLKEIADAAAARPQCRFPIQYEKGFACLLPHLGSLRQAARVLQVRALAELNTGQTDAAFNDVRLMLRLDNAFETEPILVSLLVRISFNNLALEPVWEGLADHRWSDAQLQQLQHDLATINLLNNLDTAFHGERCMAKWCLNELLNNPRAIFMLGGSDNKSGPGLVIMRLIPSGWIYFNCLNVDLFYQQHILQCVDSRAGRIYPARTDAVESALWKTVKPGGFINPYRVLEGVLVPTVSHLIVKVGVAQTTTQSAALACALERYRLANNRYPDQLAALVPQFIAAVPRDVVDGQPLRYRLTGTNYVIYSIGWNQKDDGGQIVFKKQTDPKAKPQLDEKLGDWVWRSQPAS